MGFSSFQVAIGPKKPYFRGTSPYNGGYVLRIGMGWTASGGLRLQNRLTLPVLLDTVSAAPQFMPILITMQAMIHADLKHLELDFIWHQVLCDSGGLPECQISNYPLHHLQAPAGGPSPAAHSLPSLSGGPQPGRAVQEGEGFIMTKSFAYESH